MSGTINLLFVLSVIISFAVSFLTTRFIIPKLKSKKVGQTILEIGPRWHKNKEGTPTMGGIAFIFTFVLSTAVFGTLAMYFSGFSGVKKYLITAVMILLYGLIGIIDDWLKLFKKKNEGLSVGQKYLLQLLVAAAFLFAMSTSGYITTSLYIPFVNTSVELSWFYYVFAAVLITGVVNAVTLTDGIDGLCSGVTLIVAIFFAVASFIIGKECVPSFMISSVIIGILPGFLIYNFYPAKIFMGDTGSLFLGGAVVGLAFLINNPLIIIIAGIIYIIEALSDIIQVLVYKLTKKRVFKMAPIHHHFEKCGWSELKINFVFCLVTVIACALSLLGVAG